ncbi:hypothetical protein ACLMJK_009469 [Lecanora helva]
MTDPSTPPKPPGERLASYFENFFRTVVGISTLGASITFSKIVQSPIEPFHSFGYSGRQVQYLLAASWLLFVLCLAFTSFIASALSLWRPSAVKAFGTKDGEERDKVLWFASGVTALLLGLLVAAFLTLALVVVAYVGPIGWVAFASFVMFGVLGFGVIIWRSPIEWPKWVARLRRTKRQVLEGGLSQDREKVDRRYEDDLVRERSRRRQDQRHSERERGMPQEQQDYGRSSSGDYAGGRWRQIQRDEGYNTNRYSKASTIMTDAYGPELYGQREVMMYDDGVREGLVVGNYPR